MEEFLILADVQERDPQDTVWTIERTKSLINYYKLYVPQLRSLNVRNKKEMWKKISENINEEFGTSFKDNNVENRWRVLLRNYKLVIDRNESGNKHVWQ